MAKKITDTVRLTWLSDCQVIQGDLVFSEQFRTGGKIPKKITDKERLDWLEIKTAEFFAVPHHFHNYRRHVNCCAIKTCKSDKFESVRDAMTAAMRGEKR